MARREPTIDGGEKIVGRIAFALIAPEPRPAGAGAMLVAYRLAGLSALEAYYAGVGARAQYGADALSHRGLARGAGGGSRRVFRFRTADFIRHAEEAVSPPASF